MAFRYYLWAQMIIEKHHYLQLVHLIKIFHYQTLLAPQRYWQKSTGRFISFSYLAHRLPPTLCFNKNIVYFSILFVNFNREKLCGHLPARAEGYSWSLVFSTSQNGFSLNSLYRKLQRIESPILVVIQDTDNNVNIKSFREFHLCLFCFFFSKNEINGMSHFK